MLENVPCRLERLPELAYNLFWTWRDETRELFRRLDPELWEVTQHNPVRLLRETPNLGAAAEDAGFVEAYHRSLRDLDGYLGRRDTWMARAYPDFPGPVAYFSAEFGVHESLPVYSGGLGILAGDHLKSASILASPLSGLASSTLRATSASASTPRVASKKRTKTWNRRAGLSCPPSMPRAARCWLASSCQAAKCS